MTETAKATEEKKTTAKAEETTLATEWTGSYTDLDNIQRNFKVTESDGTTIDVNIKWPGKQEAENMTGMAYANINGKLRETPGDYHKELFKLFGKPVINGKTSSAVVNADFFEEHEDKTYDYMMEHSDTFLTRTPETTK